MKCLNCGCSSEYYICETCTTIYGLEKIFEEIRTYKPETCENPYLLEFASNLTEKYAERDIIPDILEQFDFDEVEFYWCQYYKMRRDPRFEEAAITYIEKHDMAEVRTQNIIYNLIDSYIPNDFIKPQKWCNIVNESAEMCCELYAIAAKYFSMIGEYELSDNLADKGIELCKNGNSMIFSFNTQEKIIERFEKQKADTERYRTKKPYWPVTEERRRAVAMFYDEKGIKYPRIESKPKKIKESEFAPINECFDEEIQDYCAFWCNETDSVSAAKCIYQIAAVRVSGEIIVDSFESFVRPWDSGRSAKKTAAKEIGVSLEIIEAADDVDLVMPRFFDFVGDSVLVSTGALGNQAKLISRAARYTGMTEIKNEFYDLLDLAADTSEEFDLVNNTREYLINYFSISEGKTALEKAKANKQIYDALINYGD